MVGECYRGRERLKPPHPRRTDTGGITADFGGDDGNQGDCEEFEEKKNDAGDKFRGAEGGIYPTEQIGKAGGTEDIRVTGIIDETGAARDAHSQFDIFLTIECDSVLPKGEEKKADKECREKRNRKEDEK